MTTPPRSDFNSAEAAELFGSTLPAKKERLQIQINTEARKGYRLAVPGQTSSRPENLGSITPPDSPARTRASTMGAQDSMKLYDSGAITPPATPISSSHTKSSSTSSDFLTALSGLRRGDSTSSRISRLSLDEPARPGSTELLTFPHHFTDYSIQVDGKGRKRSIGFGAWSNVYIAEPSLSHPGNQPTANVVVGSPSTPPITPVRSRGLSISKSNLLSIPSLYAIKAPASTSAKRVLDAEAQIISYLSRFPNANNHVVPFYGQDTRTGALVLEAMDGTLEDWIQQNLNALDESSRAQKLVNVFPFIAKSLMDSLIWLQDKNCIHADIKPSNILVSPSTSTTPHVVLSDFSSTILTTLSTSATPAPMGAGTWEFLDPSLLSSLHPATPCAATDLWSLGITLLFLILGLSPFDAFKGNKYQQREMIKSGAPLQCLQHDDQGILNMRRLKALSTALGFDVMAWFGKVLVKNKDKRVSIVEWKAELSHYSAQLDARI